MILGWRRFVIMIGVLGIGFVSLLEGKDLGGNTLTVLMTLIPLYFANSYFEKWLKSPKPEDKP